MENIKQMYERKNLFKLLLGLMVYCFVFTDALTQSLISEKMIPLDKDQKKNEVEFALYNPNTDGITVFFEIQKGEKVKGQKRTYKRYEIDLNNNLDIVSAEYKTLGTKNSVKPRIYFKDFRIGYTTWVDDETEDKINKVMLQIIKFDNNNKIIDIKDYELCEEKGFDYYKILPYNGELIVMAQYEKKKTKDKNEKNRDYMILKRIDPVTMETKLSEELNLLGKDELALESYLISNDKIFLVGKQLLQTKILGIKIPQKWLIFRLNLDGKEEARGEITIPDKAMGISSVYIAEGNGMIYLAGEYGYAKDVTKTPAPSSGKTVTVKNPNIGMFIKRFDYNLEEKGTATFSYKEKILKKLKKGNPKFTKKKGLYNLRDFYFLPDGSFYIVSEMYSKTYESVKTTSGTISITNNYTHYDYMDAVVFKFTPNGELDWLVQIDRDNYRLTYQGFIRSLKPLEPGKLETFLTNDGRLIALYNTPGRKYNKKRFGLSEVIISPDGSMTNPVDYNNNFQFCMIDGGIIKYDDNTIFAVGTDRKYDNLWIKKIRLLD